MNNNLPDYKMIQSLPQSSDTLLVVPVFNEMPHLPKVLCNIRQHWKGDILAVDDNSTDSSLQALKNFPEISILHNLSNAGAGGVLLRGWGYAIRKNYENVITMDADGQHSPECISCFLHELEKCRCCCGCDFVWGSRYINGIQKISPQFSRRQNINIEITSRLNEVTGYQLTDAFCGFRAYHCESLAKLNITETGYGMFMQLTIQAARMGMVIREIPVPLIYLDETRDFNDNFNDSAHRLQYYHNIINDEIKRESNFCTNAATCTESCDCLDSCQ